jgi:hypothetical protein
MTCEHQYIIYYKALMPFEMCSWLNFFSIVHLFSFSGKTNRPVKSYRTSAPVIHKKTDRFLWIFSTWIQFPRTQTRQYTYHLMDESTSSLLSTCFQSPSYITCMVLQLNINMLQITLDHMHGFTHKYTLVIISIQKKEEELVR